MPPPSGAATSSPPHQCTDADDTRRSDDSRPSGPQAIAEQLRGNDGCILRDTRRVPDRHCLTDVAVGFRLAVGAIPADGEPPTARAADGVVLHEPLLEPRPTTFQGPVVVHEDSNVADYTLDLYLLQIHAHVVPEPCR